MMSFKFDRNFHRASIRGPSAAHLDSPSAVTGIEAKVPLPIEDRLVAVEDVSKWYVSGNRFVAAIDHVSFSVRRGEFLAIVGPSGCGKSTLLNLIAGLSPPPQGRILFDGLSVRGPNTRVGYMTQTDNLMPWRTLARNVALPLEIRRHDRRDIQLRTRHMLELVGLHGFEDAYPAELSGGMRKRAALARTLIYDPEVILADEPFGSLDAQLRLELQREFLRIWGEALGRRRTVLFVTHDLEEAVSLADRVIVMTRRPGRIKLDRVIPLSRPRDVYEARFTREFAAIHEELWQGLETSRGPAS